MIKKILWVCNTPLPQIKSRIGLKNKPESWLIGMSNQLCIRSDIELNYAFPQKVNKRLITQTVDGIVFWGFYDARKKIYDINNENIKFFSDIIKKINPDIIHIFGTEFPHSLEWVKASGNINRVIVSVQGLTSEIAKVYLSRIPIKDCFAGHFANGKYNCVIGEKYDFYRRGKNEKELLATVKNVIGRTDWDKQCVQHINPKCQYYHCNEVLRDVFYYGKWNINTVDRNSIFVSQAHYPIKGFHILISALPFIKLRFPNVRIYVAGYKNNGAYGEYIKRIMKKYHVENEIVFLGILSDEKIKKKLLKSHIAVMPSIIENSPNSIGEAMILGVPVVAADVGGIPSIMCNKKSGYLYPSANEKKLARAICKIFENDELALKFSYNGQKWAEKLYNKRNNSERLLNIYNQI